MQIVPYEDIPRQFRHHDNPWNKLTQHVYDTGQSGDVRLISKVNHPPEDCWRAFCAVLDVQELNDFHKIAWAAWVLSIGFEKFFYEYDD